MRRLKTAASSSVHGKDAGLLRAGISLETSRSLEVLSKPKYEKHSFSYSNVCTIQFIQLLTVYSEKKCLTTKGNRMFCFVLLFFNKDVFLKNI